MRIIRSGVYRITCLENARCYVGSSKDLTSRQNKHFYDLRKNKHCNPHLQNTWNKYGEQAFVFEILEECEPTKEALVSLEQRYLDTLKPEFNICPKAHSRQGSPVSVETRLKLRMTQLGKPKNPDAIEKTAAAHRGKKLTAEQIAKRVDKMRGRKHTPEHIAKIAASLKGRTFSTETRNKLSMSQKGKPRNPESIKRGAETRRGKFTQNQRRAMIPIWHSPENKKKISEAVREAFVKRLKQSDRVSGITWDKKRCKWTARLQANGIVKYLGRFEMKEEAIAARLKAQEEYLLNNT